MNPAFSRNILIQAALLMGFWLALSGIMDVFHVAIGAVAVALVIVLSRRTRNRPSAGEEKVPGVRLNLFRFLLFIPWLVKEIVVASLQVAYIVLHPRVPADPVLLRFKTRLPGAGARVILGNSITLTPGTLTLRIWQDEFLVHALSPVSFGGIVNGTLPRQVARLYSPAGPQSPAGPVYDLVVIKSKKEL
ncbi:MAG: Na+/H+ antiporter subunit E [Kiritimatiellae bacterium]|nr:Na+/H+ antiporter subunit E [Kiritimatiellia bacterium]